MFYCCIYLIKMDVNSSGFNGHLDLVQHVPDPSSEGIRINYLPYLCGHISFKHLLCGSCTDEIQHFQFDVSAVSCDWYMLAENRSLNCLILCSHYLINTFVCPYLSLSFMLSLSLPIVHVHVCVVFPSCSVLEFFDGWQVLIVHIVELRNSLNLCL